MIIEEHSVHVISIPLYIEYPTVRREIEESLKDSWERNGRREPRGRKLDVKNTGISLRYPSSSFKWSSIPRW